MKKRGKGDKWLRTSRQKTSVSSRDTSRDTPFYIAAFILVRGRSDVSPKLKLELPGSTRDVAPSFFQRRSNHLSALSRWFSKGNFRSPSVSASTKSGYSASKQVLVQATLVARIRNVSPLRSRGLILFFSPDPTGTKQCQRERHGWSQQCLGKYIRHVQQSFSTNSC